MFLALKISKQSLQLYEGSSNKDQKLQITTRAMTERQWRCRNLTIDELLFDQKSFTVGALYYFIPIIPKNTRIPCTHMHTIQV